MCALAEGKGLDIILVHYRQHSTQAVYQFNDP